MHKEEDKPGAFVYLHEDKEHYILASKNLNCFGANFSCLEPSLAIELKV